MPWSRPHDPRRLDGRVWSSRFLRNVLLWLVPVGLLWLLITPVYNQILLTAGGNLVRLTESPDVTDLVRHPTSYHHAYVSRRDFPPVRRLVHQFRTTDVHFHLVLLGVLFLAVPGVAWRRKIENLGWAVLITIFFDLFVLFFMVKSVYATGLGDWSLAHYGPVARNVYGLANHLMDLPFKLALPFVLWAGFYLGDLLGPAAPERSS
jgi:hypothetical protein